MTNLLPFAMAWLVVVIAVIAVAFMRKHVASQEDDSLHLGGGSETAIEHQQDTAKKLAKLDFWGKILTIIMVVAGLALGIIYGWRMWEASSTAGM